MSRSGVPAAASSWLSHFAWRYPRRLGTTRLRTTCSSAAQTARSWRGLAWPGEILETGVSRALKACAACRPRSSGLGASAMTPRLTTCAFSAAAVNVNAATALSPVQRVFPVLLLLKLLCLGFGLACFRGEILHLPVFLPT